MRHVLSIHHQFEAGLNEVHALLDSIDVSRHLLLHHAEEGITLQDFSARLADINHYIARSQEKIHSMEAGLQSSRNDASNYFMLVISLKDEMQLREDQISDLQQHMASFKTQNHSAEKKIQITDIAAKNAWEELAAEDEKLLALESRIDALAKKLKNSKADAYYAQALQVEEIARRTKLARQKKRDAYKEALELYKKALSLGKDEARTNIIDLERRLDD